MRKKVSTQLTFDMCQKFDFLENEIWLNQNVQEASGSIMGTPASLRDVQWLRKQILDERVCLRVILLQRDFGPVGDLRNFFPR